MCFKIQNSLKQIQGIFTQVTNSVGQTRFYSAGQQTV
jgi:hypothetical protein